MAPAGQNTKNTKNTNNSGPGTGGSSLKTIMRQINPASAIEVSQNRKLGAVSATYASQSTCPASCPLRNAGCYAEAGRMGLHTRRLNDSDITKPEAVAQVEADAIDRLTGRFPLRLHVVGDSPNAECARIVSDAAGRHTAKHGQPVWTYTHALDVPREAWGSVSVLRSCERVADVVKALEEGFGAAMVVPEFKQDTAYEIAEGLTGIPCPEMTGKADSCLSCGLCMKADKLRAGRKVILFAAHGSRTKTVQNNLRVLAS